MVLESLPSPEYKCPSKAASTQPVYLFLHNVVQKHRMWWWGDWLRFGERKYGEMYSQAIDHSKLDYQTLANSTYVSGAVEFSRRRENLSWSHHKEIASLEPEDQDYPRYAPCPSNNRDTELLVANTP